MYQLDRASKWSIIAIGVVVVFTALSIGSAIFAPLALAIVTGAVMSPLSDFWQRRGYSPVWGALVGLLVTVVILSSLILIFQPVVSRLVEQAPRVWTDLREIIDGLRQLIKSLTEVSADVTAAMAAPENATAGAAAEQAVADAVQMPSVATAIAAAPAIMSQVLIFVGALFFFLLSRTEIFDWLAAQLTPRDHSARLAERMRVAERIVSRYFLTISVINAALGLLTAVVLRLMGVEDAMIWGAVAFLLNFLVYIGPAIFVVLLLYLGVAEFDGIMAFAPAVAFLFMNSLEGQFITPALVGRTMAVNPLLVFMSLIFGIWLWGPIGGIVAIPLVLWILVLFDMLDEPEPVEEEAETQPA